MKAALGAFATIVFLASASHAAASFELVNGDGAGEGLNDPTPVTPTGGNPATTLGEARRYVLGRMFSEISCHLDSAVPTRITVSFNPMACDTTSGILASAGPTTASRNFPSAPRANTFYPVALANALAGVDLNGTTGEVVMTFNSSVGTSGCINGTFWYLGVDSNSPLFDVDMYSVGLHELLHGLGFLTFQNASTGEKMFSTDDIFMVNLSLAGSSTPYPALTDMARAAANRAEPNLLWSGPRLVGDFGGTAAIYAPSTYLDGSSVNHLSARAYPSELMSPFYEGPVHDPGRALSVLADEGWTVRAQCRAPSAAPATPTWALVLLGGLLVSIAGSSLVRTRRSQVPQKVL